MKRLIAAAVLLIIIFIGGALERKTVGNICESMKKETAAVTNEKTLNVNSLKEFNKQWNKRKNLLLIFVNREYISRIDNLTQKIDSAVQKNNASQIEEIAREINICAKEISEETEFSISAFF